MNVYTLDEGARLDYGVQWADWLAGVEGDDDDVIVSSSWTVDPGITSENPTHDDYTTTLFLKDGTSEVTYWATNQIVTFKGRIMQWTIGIMVVPVAN